MKMCICSSVPLPSATRHALERTSSSSKGHQGTIRLFADREQQTEITDDNYASIAPMLVGKDIYFTVEE